MRYGARRVARGSQVPVTDFFETHAPVAKVASMRILFAISAHNNFEIRQIDVNLEKARSHTCAYLLVST